MESCKILIIDDKEDKREALGDYVTALGHQPLYALEGAEGLVRAEEEMPHLILLDIMMPQGMGGVECLKHLKAEPELSGIPVIIISAKESSGAEEEIPRCLELGAVDYLPMPPKYEILKARITSSLERRLQDLREDDLNRQLKKAFRKARDEEIRADNLLKAIFPRKFVSQLKDSGEVRPERRENVAILFSDIVGFTTWCDQHEPEDAVEHLQKFVTSFEAISEQNRLEKIKTIGDAYMAAAGLLDDDPEAVLNSVRGGLAMVAASAEFAAGWQVRVGIHIGPVVAGKIGRSKFAYDVWGATVNLAARIESAAQPGQVWVSSPAWDRISDRCIGMSQGVRELKGIGGLELWRVDAVK